MIKKHNYNINRMKIKVKININYIKTFKYEIIIQSSR